MLALKNIIRKVFGRFYWVQFSKQLKYRGAWKNNLFNGKGTLIYSNGSTYTGHFFEGAKNGHGHYISSEGFEYIGDWIGGKQTGHAQISYKNGDLYTGRVKDGLRHGRGEFFQVVTNRNCKGLWSKDVLKENIEITDPHWTFKGSFEIAAGTGKGILQYKDGSKYSGHIIDFRRDGKGTLEFKSGEAISGIWSDNVNVQSATITDDHGFQWMGDLHNMQPNGFMKIRRPDGILYDSVWDNGAMLQSLCIDISSKRGGI